MNDMSIAATPQSSPVGFAARPGFIRLLLKNAVLSVLTLGIYRFWARTSVRRYLWNNVVIAGEPLEYTGRGIELFIGFLIAAAILFPLSLAYSLVQNFVVTDPWSAGILFGIYVLAIMTFTQVAIYRARRYRLSRTLWRGIGCSQDGSTWRYVALSMGWSLSWLLTLGLVHSWAYVSLRRYEMTHTLFGDRRFTFDGRGRDLFLSWLAIYAIAIVPLLIFAGMNVEMWYQIANFGTVQPPRSPSALLREMRGWWIFPLCFPAMAAAYVAYSVNAIRYVFDVTELGGVRFYSAARTPTVLLYILGLCGTMLLWCLGLTIIIGGLLLVVVLGADIAGTPLPKGKEVGGTLAIVGGVIAWLGVYFGYYLFSKYWLLYRVVRHFCATLTAVNIVAIESVMQSASSRPARGEGLADAFDVGAI